jgi:hypothetical protein
MKLIALDSINKIASAISVSQGIVPSGTRSFRPCRSLAIVFGLLLPVNRGMSVMPAVIKPVVESSTKYY